jgi:hypothetical protein
MTKRMSVISPFWEKARKSGLDRSSVSFHLYFSGHEETWGLTGPQIRQLRQADAVIGETFDSASGMIRWTSQHVDAPSDCWGRRFKIMRLRTGAQKSSAAGGIEMFKIGQRALLSSAPESGAGCSLTSAMSTLDAATRAVFGGTLWFDSLISLTGASHLCVIGAMPRKARLRRPER